MQSLNTGASTLPLRLADLFQRNASSWGRVSYWSISKAASGARKIAELANKKLGQLFYSAYK